MLHTEAHRHAGKPEECTGIIYSSYTQPSCTYCRLHIVPLRHEMAGQALLVLESKRKHLPSFPPAQHQTNSTTCRMPHPYLPLRDLPNLHKTASTGMPKVHGDVAEATSQIKSLAATGTVCLLQYVCRWKVPHGAPACPRLCINSLWTCLLG